MPGKTRLKPKIIIFLILLVTCAVLVYNQFYGAKQLQRAVREVERLQVENQSLRDEVEDLKKENQSLKSRLREQKLLNLERETGLVRIDAIDDTIIIDLRYATENNFTGQKLYPVAVGLLQRGTAEKLKNANDRFKQDGYRIKVWDAYRPLDIQKKFWELVPDRRYVADPRYGSKHNRGAAVDITLVDEDGNEVAMPTGFDHFSEQAWRIYRGNPPEVQRNMEYLGRVMEENGFIPNSTEWWHFDDSQWQSYPVLNIGLEEFAGP